MLKRNDIVVGAESNGHFDFYGRVSRVFPDGTVEIIDCGRNITVGPASAFARTDYKGRPDHLRPSIVRRMPSLRRLKQMAARHDTTIWKARRKPATFPKTTIFL